VLWRRLTAPGAPGRGVEPAGRLAPFALAALVLAASAATAGARPPAAAQPDTAAVPPTVVPADSAATRPAGPPDLPTRSLGPDDLMDRDDWFFRGLRSLVGREDPMATAASGDVTQLAQRPFLAYAGRPIHSVIIFGRKAFGALGPLAGAADGAPDGGPDATSEDGPEDGARGDADQDGGHAMIGTMSRLLNSLAPRTHESVIRDYLLFRAGEPLDPFALADSERLLRDLPFIQDVRIEVFPLLERQDEAVTVIVLVRDRWPWGVRVDIKNARRWDAAFYHRNVGGLGLDLESQLLVAGNEDPEVGWALRARRRNLRGSFVDLTAEARRAWDRDRTVFAADRRFVYPDIRLVGGWSLASEDDHDHDDLPDGVSLRTRTLDTWLGWGLAVGGDGRGDRRRTRLIPAAGIERVDYRDPPRAYADSDRDWRDRTRYLAQLNLADVDYYTASLVFGYGETEDIPAGLWAALTGGYERSDWQDRWYHGGRVVWRRVSDTGGYLVCGAAYGGFRRAGRFEDGVLDLDVGGFGALHRRGPGYWRHFALLRYTLGVNQTGDPLRLDRAGLRDLDDERIAGNQRLVLDLETVFFTPYALLGFKAAAFGYASGGFVADRREPVFDQRLYSDLGLGLRLNNPQLVLPTIELRVGVVIGDGDPEPVISVRMGERKVVTRDAPGARPSVLSYR